jgi:hypothetical protein
MSVAEAQQEVEFIGAFEMSVRNLIKHRRGMGE